MNDLDDVAEEADTLAELVRPSRRSAQSRAVVVDPDSVLERVWPYRNDGPGSLLFNANRAPRMYLLSLVAPEEGLAAARLESAKKGAEHLCHRVVDGLWKELELLPLVEPGRKRDSTHWMARAFSESVTNTTSCGRQVTRAFMRWMSGGPPPSLVMFNCMGMFVREGYVGDASARDHYPWETTSLKIPPACACTLDMLHCYGTPAVHHIVDWSRTAEPACGYGDEIAGAFLSGLASFDSNTGELTDPDSLTYSDRFLMMSTFCFVRGVRDCISLAQDTDGYRLGLQFKSMTGGPGGPLDKDVSQIFLLTPSDRWMKDGDLTGRPSVELIKRARETGEHWLGVVALAFYLNYGKPYIIGEGSLVEQPRHLVRMAKRLHQMFDRTRSFAARAERGDDSHVRVWEREVSQGVKDALVAWGWVPADISDADLATFVAALPNLHVDCLSLKDAQWYRILVFDEVGNLVRCVQPRPLPNLLTWPPAPSRVDDATFIDLDDPKYRAEVLDDAALRLALGKNESVAAVRARSIDWVCLGQLNDGITCKNKDGGKCGYRYHFGGLFSSDERRLARDGDHDLCRVCGWPFVLMGGGSARCQNAYCQHDYYMDVVDNALETGGELPVHWNTRDNDRSVARRIADAKAARVGTPAANPPPQELLAQVTERATLIKELTDLGCDFNPEEHRVDNLRRELEKKKREKAGVGGTKKGDRVVVLENNGHRTKAYAGRTGVVKKVKSAPGWRDVLFDGKESVTGIQDKFLRKITAAASAPAPASADMEL